MGTQRSRTAVPKLFCPRATYTITHLYEGRTSYVIWLFRKGCIPPNHQFLVISFFHHWQNGFAGRSLETPVLEWTPWVRLLSASTPVSDVSALACTNGVWPLLRLVSFMRKRTNRRPRCSPLSNTSTSPWTARVVNLHKCNKFIQILTMWLQTWFAWWCVSFHVCNVLGYREKTKGFEDYQTWYQINIAHFMYEIIRFTSCKRKIKVYCMT